MCVVVVIFKTISSYHDILKTDRLPTVKTAEARLFTDVKKVENNLTAVFKKAIEAKSCAVSC